MFAARILWQVSAPNFLSKTLWGTDDFIGGQSGTHHWRVQGHWRRGRKTFRPGRRGRRLQLQQGQRTRHAGGADARSTAPVSKLSKPTSAATPTIKSWWSSPSPAWVGWTLSFPTPVSGTRDDLPVEKMSEKQWDDMIRVNLTSVYSLIHFSVPHMIKQKSGKIIPISSTAGQRGESFIPITAHPKAASSASPRDWPANLPGITFLLIPCAPGWVATDMSNAVLESKAGQKMVAAAIPLGRPATAEEIAGPSCFWPPTWPTS